MGPPPPGPLPDELVEEILLRLPPADPAHLVRAAVASKRWCRLVADPVFRRRYRARHGAPPMLGFLCDARDSDGYSTRFVPTSPSLRPRRRRPGYRDLRPEDARHGRVLLRYSPLFWGVDIPTFGLIVWDPITDHRVVLPRPKGFCDKWKWKATVLCAASPGACDHLSCRQGPFTVVIVGSYPRGMLSCIYSSEAGTWSRIIFAQDGRIQHLNCCKLGEERGRSAHVGNALYCMLENKNRILRYDLGTREFSVVEPPPLLSCLEFTRSEQIELTTMEDGRLGLAVVRESTLYILSRDEEFGWQGPKTIDLKQCGLHVSSATKPHLVGFAGDVGLAFFLRYGDGILSLDVKSPRVNKLYESSCSSCIVPYMNFCTPVMGVTKRNNVPRVGASSGGQSSCVASRFLSPAIRVPSKDDRPRVGASSDGQSCIASRIPSQAKAGGQSQQPVAHHRARAAERLQSQRLHFARRPGPVIRRL